MKFKRLKNFKRFPNLTIFDLSKELYNVQQFTRFVY